MTSELRRLGDIVSEAARSAAGSALRYQHEIKPDGSVVTAADLETERVLRKVLTAEWTGTSVWGEEFGFEEMGTSGLWLVDPIDGTSNFYSGNPLWGVSVALMDHDSLRLGAIVLPELGIELVSERGQGTFWNGVRLEPQAWGEVLPHELVSVNDSALKHIGERVTGKPRLCGAFVVDGAFTVRRWFKALYGMNEKLYDVAASVLAAREIGLAVAYCDETEWHERDLATDIKIAKPWRIGPG